MCFTVKIFEQNHLGYEKIDYFWYKKLIIENYFCVKTVLWFYLALIEFSL